MISLSICIPTHNFGRFIGQTLESILPQMTAEVEVVILDGGSTDDTDAVVRTRAGGDARVRYVHLGQRGGIDRDMALAVELARGEYCWLFSADDTMAPGALGEALGACGSGIDIFLCGLTLCDFYMRPLGRHPVLEAAPGAVFDLSVHEERVDYFRRAVTTTAFFSFCSSLLFRRVLWERAPLDESFVGSCWAHVPRFFANLPHGLRVQYVKESRLFKRGDNDSFLEAGIVNRIGIAVDGFNRIADSLFGHDSEEAFHVRRTLRNEYSLAHLLYAKLRAHARGTHEDPGRLQRARRQALRGRVGEEHRVTDSLPSGSRVCPGAREEAA